MNRSITIFRYVAMAEAISFLLLLGIAMPLKYIWHLPIAVRIAGSLHGLLFISFCITLNRLWDATNWAFSRVGLLFLSSLIPLAPFFMDPKIRLWTDQTDSEP